MGNMVLGSAAVILLLVAWVTIVQVGAIIAARITEILQVLP